MTSPRAINPPATNADKLERESRERLEKLLNKLDAASNLVEWANDWLYAYTMQTRLRHPYYQSGDDAGRLFGVDARHRDAVEAVWILAQLEKRIHAELAGVRLLINQAAGIPAGQDDAR